MLFDDARRNRLVPMWKASYAIGVPAIDQQHIELFARADSLLQAMREGRGAEECKRLFAFLHTYVAVHFASEERLMAARRYAGLQGHRAQHAEFVRRFQEIVEDFSAQGVKSATVIDLQGLIGSWLVQHIGAEDAKVAAFFGTLRGDVRL